MEHLLTWQSSDGSLRLDVWHSGIIPPFYDTYKVVVFDNRTLMGQGVIMDDDCVVSVFVPNKMGEVLFAAAICLSGSSDRLNMSGDVLGKTDNRLAELRALISEVVI